jgi:hypothetical protein
MRGLSGLNTGNGRGCDFPGVPRFFCLVFAGEFVVVWMVDGGEFVVLVWWRKALFGICMSLPEVFPPT